MTQDSEGNLHIYTARLFVVSCSTSLTPKGYLNPVSHNEGTIKKSSDPSAKSSRDRARKLEPLAAGQTEKLETPPLGAPVAADG